MTSTNPEFISPYTLSQYTPEQRQAIETEIMYVFEEYAERIIDHRIRVSFIEPLSDGSMLKIVDTDPCSYVEQKEFHLEGFNWSPDGNYSSFAGQCATFGKRVISFHLEKERNDSSSAWVKTKGRSMSDVGIMCEPVISEMQTCLGVICITWTEEYDLDDIDRKEVLGKLDQVCDRIAKILYNIDMKEQYQPLDPETEEALDTLVNEITKNPYNPHKDTLYESATNLFKRKGKQGVLFTELKALIPDSVDDKDAAVGRLVFRLKQKALIFNHTLERESIYFFVPLTESDE